MFVSMKTSQSTTDLGSEYTGSAVCTRQIRGAAPWPGSLSYSGQGVISKTTSNLR